MVSCKPIMNQPPPAFARHPPLPAGGPWPPANPDGSRRPVGFFWFPWGKWLIAMVVFFHLPFLLLNFGMGTLWTRRETQAREQAMNQLEIHVSDLAVQGNTRGFISRSLQRVHDEASAFPARRPAILRRWQRLLDREFPRFFHWYVTDRNGDLIAECSSPQAPRRVIRELYQVAVSKWRNDPQHDDLRRRFQERIWPFIGPQARRDFLAPLGPGQSTIMAETRFGEEKTFFFIHLTAEGALFAHINQRPDWARRALDVLVRRLNRRRGPMGWRAGTLIPSETKPLHPEVAAAHLAFERTGQARYFGRTSLVIFRRIHPGLLLWLQRPAPSDKIAQQARWWLVLGGALLGFLIHVGSFRVFSGRWPLTLSIRHRLILLFLFMAGLPLLAVWLLGVDYLSRQEGILRARAETEIQDTLRGFDQQFLRELSLLNDRLREAIDLSFGWGGKRPPVPQRRSRWFRRQFQVEKLYLFDQAGQVVYSHPPPGDEGTESERRFIGKLSAKALRDLNQEPPTEAGQATDLVWSAIGGDEESWKGILRDLGKIVYFDLSGEQTYAFMHAIKDRSGISRRFIVLTWQRQHLHTQFVRKHLLEQQRLIPGGRLWATTPTGGIVAAPTELDRLNPRLFQRLAPLLNARQSTSFRVGKGDAPRLLVGFAAREMNGLILWGARTESDIQRDLHQFRFGLGLFLAGIALLALGLGGHLSEGFLVPVADVSRGVEAIQRRDFRHRVPVGPPDELGRLAATFNQVMEGLADLEVGRFVQENLMPREEIVWGEYRVFGRSRFLTALSGDYFDLKVLPGNRLFFLVGDVAGHGVGAALVMAMAKALVEREIPRGTTASGFLTILNQVLRATLRRGSMMTCAVGLLDMRTHRLSFANAGQCPAVQLTGPDTWQEVALPSKPLGVSSSWQGKELIEEFSPGHRWLLFTDGLIEARTPGGMLGFAPFQAAAARLVGSNPRAGWEALMAWHDAARQGIPPTDDMTLLIIARHGEADSTSEATGAFRA